MAAKSWLTNLASKVVSAVTNKSSSSSSSKSSSTSSNRSGTGGNQSGVVSSSSSSKSSTPSSSGTTKSAGTSSYVAGTTRGSSSSSSTKSSSSGSSSSLNSKGTTTDTHTTAKQTGTYSYNGTPYTTSVANGSSSNATTSTTPQGSVNQAVVAGRAIPGSSGTTIIPSSTDTSDLKGPTGGGYTIPTTTGANDASARDYVATPMLTLASTGPTVTVPSPSTGYAGTGTKGSNNLLTSLNNFFARGPKADVNVTGNTIGNPYATKASLMSITNKTATEDEENNNTPVSDSDITKYLIRQNDYAKFLNNRSLDQGGLLGPSTWKSGIKYEDGTSAYRPTNDLNLEKNLETTSQDLAARAAANNQDLNTLLSENKLYNPVTMETTGIKPATITPKAATVSTESPSTPSTVETPQTQAQPQPEAPKTPQYDFSAYTENTQKKLQSIADTNPELLQAAMDWIDGTTWQFDGFSINSLDDLMNVDFNKEGDAGALRAELIKEGFSAGQAADIIAAMYDQFGVTRSEAYQGYKADNSSTSSQNIYGDLNKEINNLRNAANQYGIDLNNLEKEYLGKAASNVQQMMPSIFRAAYNRGLYSLGSGANSNMRNLAAFATASNDSNQLLSDQQLAMLQKFADYKASNKTKYDAENTITTALTNALNSSLNKEGYTDYSVNSAKINAQASITTLQMSLDDASKKINSSSSSTVDMKEAANQYDLSIRNGEPLEEGALTWVLQNMYAGLLSNQAALDAKKKEYYAKFK